MTSTAAAAAARSVGIIGLSATYAWANSSHLPALLSSPNFRVTALSGRNKQNVLAARTHHNLPSSINLYDSPSAIAADPSVDLITVTTRVDTHYAIVKEILTSPNPKDLYVEWPLASNVAEAEELVELAEKAGVRTAVGLQGRFEENMEDVKQILESGRIGDVLSVRVEGAMGDIGQISHYFVNNKVGGNYGTIFMGHLIDTILSVVGEIKSYQSVTANQIPKWNLPTEGVVDKDTLDHFSFHGFLKSGAFFDIFFRSGKAFNPEKSITWSIYGTKGEIEITGNILIPSGGPVAIKVKDEKGNIEELPLKGQRSPDVNIGKVYEAFRVSDERVVDFKEALKRHRFLEAIGSYSRESSRFGGNVEVK